MTDLKIGKIHLRSYSKPTHWKVYTMIRSPKSGKWSERLLGWCATLSQALRYAQEVTLAGADAQSLAEVKVLLEDFQKEAKNALGE